MVLANVQFRLCPIVIKSLHAVHDEAHEGTWSARHAQAAPGAIEWVRGLPLKSKVFFETVTISAAAFLHQDWLFADRRAKNFS
jgi:hypothetical protein